jgi:hypothetical protein
MSVDKLKQSNPTCDFLLLQDNYEKAHAITFSSLLDCLYIFGARNIAFDDNCHLFPLQSEGSAIWVAAPGRDMTNLPTSSFYNLPPQGQHVTFAPTQAGHGTFASIYHPAQAVTAAAVHPLLQQSQTMAGAVDMVGPGGNVYQQPQHAQINWPSNY